MALVKHMELVSGQFNHENGIKKHIRASLEKIECSYISSFSFIYNLCVPLSTNLFIFLEKKKKKKERETQIYRTDFWTLWEKARAGCFKRTASKHVYYQGWNRLPAQVGCMRQAFGPGALGRPRGSRRRGRWEGESGWGIHVYPRLTHVNVWHKPLQYCKVISLQLIKKKKKEGMWSSKK